MPSIISQVNYKSLDDVEFRLSFPLANSPLPPRMTVFMMLCPGQNLFNFDFKINQRCLELLSRISRCIQQELEDCLPSLLAL